ncbi:hypothetical protein [Burkholderia paludis]|uniref:hypothetical protein n=1 Tax=Burkholderia paludis TaxID=1506587 RepID=UPI001269F8A8|nr:hypothetical protein [Burkholderia paludis]
MSVMGGPVPESRALGADCAYAQQRVELSRFHAFETRASCRHAMPLLPQRHAVAPRRQAPENPAGSVYGDRLFRRFRHASLSFASLRTQHAGNTQCRVFIGIRIDFAKKPPAFDTRDDPVRLPENPASKMTASAFVDIPNSVARGTTRRKRRARDPASLKAAAVRPPGNQSCISTSNNSDPCTDRRKDVYGRPE